jgi:Domain of unknown function (DUF4142)
MDRSSVGTLAAAVLTGVLVGGTAARAQAPVPESAMQGQNATPADERARPSLDVEPTLARMHHASQREIELGDLASTSGATAPVRNYGRDLGRQFRAFDQRVVAFAEARGISEDRLNAVFAGENVTLLRRESEDMVRLGLLRGEAFDRELWVAVVEEQSAAADMVGMLGTVGPNPPVRDLVQSMAPELDHASRTALVAARPDVKAPPTPVGP